ncbi:MAG: Ig-like domain-containing protein [Isosphaeraceae bacterium]
MRRCFRVEPLEDRTLLATVTVDLLGFSFSPSDVTISVGDTVHWVWRSDFHSTTSVSGSAEQWDSGVLNSGFTFDHTFTQAGTFVYYCVIHGDDNGNGTASGMAGTVTVQSAATLQSIAVTPADPSIAKGLTQQFTATGTYSDDSTQDLTAQVTWASADTAVASISDDPGSKGVATAFAQGTSTISAMFGGVSGSTVLTVTAAVLQSISVAPPDPSVPVGEVQPFTATGSYSDSTTLDLTAQVIWASADTAIATVTSDGLASGLAVGTSNITATLGDVSGSTVLTVTPAALVMIMIAPADTTVSKGQTVSFTATGMYTDNSTLDLTGQVTWTSSDTAVAPVSNDPGSQGMATALENGTTTIGASLDGVSGTTTLTVATSDLNPVAVRDNSHAGFYQYGIWSVAAGGFNGTHSGADPATSRSATARWLLNVSPGTYEVWATWQGGSSNASNASYSIHDGFASLGTSVQNQQLPPSGGRFGEQAWAMLGTFTVTAGRMTVILSVSGADGRIIADGVLLVPSGNLHQSAALLSSPEAGPDAANQDAGILEALTTTTPTGPTPPVQAVPRTQTTAAPARNAPPARPDAPSPPVTAGAATAARTTVVSPGDGSRKSVALSKRAPRRFAERHQLVRESLVRWIASERVFHNRATGSSQAGR